MPKTATGRRPKHDSITPATMVASPSRTPEEPPPRADPADTEVEVKSVVNVARGEIVGVVQLINAKRNAEAKLNLRENTAFLDGVPEGYQAMAGRRALKVLVTP